jgi:hypothetical protein
MSCQIPLLDVLRSDDPILFVNDKCKDLTKIKNPSAQKLLESIITVLPKLRRMDVEDGLDEWIFEIDETDDEGIEFCVYLQSELDIVSFLLSDDDEYSEEDVLDNFGLDTIQIDKFQQVLQDKNLIHQLLREIELWTEDSFYHQNAFPHIQAIIQKGFGLPIFDGDQSRQVELTLDEDELYLGIVSESDDLDAPDYHQTHEDFDPENIEQSIERGVQAWTEFIEEDDDWDTDDLDDEEDWEQEITEDEWDDEDQIEEEWVPEFEEDED